MAGINDNHNWAWSVVGLRGSVYNGLHCFVNQAGGTGVIERMSVRLLASRCNVTKETARQIQRELYKTGFVTPEKRTTVKGKHVSNKYYLDRRRYFPKESEDYPGASIGLKIWKSLVSQLAATGRRDEAYRLSSLITQVYFDASQRKTRDGRQKGFLHLLIETDVAEEAYRDNLKWLLKLRVDGYQIIWFTPIHPIRFDRQ